MLQMIYLRSHKKKTLLVINLGHKYSINILTYDHTSKYFIYSITFRIWKAKKNIKLILETLY